LAPKKIIGEFWVLWKQIYIKWQFSISLAGQTNFLPCGPQAVAGPVVSRVRIYILIIIANRDHM